MNEIVRVLATTRPGALSDLVHIRCDRVHVRYDLVHGSPIKDADRPGCVQPPSAVPTGGGCTGFTLDHYRVVLKEGGYPASPSDGVLFVNTSATTVQALPNRAQRTYYARIYACDDAACTDKFGDAAGEVITGDTGTNSTAQEVWLIKGVQHNTVADTPLPDIYRADWDSSSQTWVPYDSADAGSCPDALIDDAHDPAVTPLGGGQYKVYVLDDAHHVTAHYFDGSSWEAGTSTPQIVFDDVSPTVVTHDCIANPDSFVASGPHEGMFMYVARSGVGFQSGTCTQGDDYLGGGGPRSSIFFAELKN